jgi:hypothetical protein
MDLVVRCNRCYSLKLYTQAEPAWLTALSRRSRIGLVLVRLLLFRHPGGELDNHINNYSVTSEAELDRLFHGIGAGELEI